MGTLKKKSTSEKSKIYSSPSFRDRVVRLACSIPKGKVTTYGRIARAAGGGPRSAQSITTILARAYADGVTQIPFHRIVYSDGSVWLSEEYREERLKRYRDENIVLDQKGNIVDFNEKLFEFR